MIFQTISWSKIFTITVFTTVLWAAVPPAQSQQDPQNRIPMAQDFERRGNHEAAVKIYRTLFEQVPQNQLYYEGLKRNLSHLKRYDELVDIINAQIQRSNDLRYQVDLADIFYKRGEQARAFELWNSLLAEHPQQNSIYPLAANAMLSNRLYDEAIQVYQTARENLKQEDAFVLELANLYVLRLQYREATLEYLNYLERFPNQFNYIEGRIANYTKEPQDAREVSEVLKQKTADHKYEYLVRRLLADLYLRIDEFESALQEFNTLEEIEPPDSHKNQGQGKEIYFFAEKALKAGQYAFAEQAYNLIVNQYPKSPFKIRALFGLALSKQKRGFAEEALQSYEELIQIAPNTPVAQEALYQIGEIYFEDLHDWEQALQTYHSLLQSYNKGPQILPTYFRIADCYTAKGDLEKAKTWYQKSLQAAGAGLNTPDRVYYHVAYIDFLNADYEAALNNLRKVTDKIGEVNSEESVINDALELSFLIEENRSQAEALQKYSESQKLAAQKKYAEATRALQEILSGYPSAPIIDESLLELGEFENQRGNFVAAIDYYENLLKEHPESVYNALAQKRIAEIYETGLGDYQKAYAAYEKVLIDYPNSLYLEEVRQKLRQLQSQQLNN